MAKKISIVGIVGAALALVGLVLAIVGMNLDVIANAKFEVSIGLFDEGWKDLEEMSELAALAGKTVPSPTFTIISFVVLIVGSVAALANGVLMVLGKNIKALGIAAGIVTLVAGVLVLVAGIVLAVTYSDFANLSGEYSLVMSTGIWLGLVGGLMGGIGSLVTTKLSAKKGK